MDCSDARRPPAFSGTPPLTQQEWPDSLLKAMSRPCSINAGARLQDYLVTPVVKAELVQQFTVDVIARGKTSGEAISAELQDRCDITIPPRTVRHHLARMGLSAIRHSLPQLLDAVKKTSKGSSGT